MIAGVKGSAVLSALLILLPRDVRAADDLAGAARELARKTVAFAGRGEPVSVSWRNLSSLASGDLNQARTAFDAALREAGGRPLEAAPIEVKLTLAANATQFLLVEEARKGDDRQVWISNWKRAATSSTPAGSVLFLEKKLVWEQEEQILDLALYGNTMLILSPSRVTLRTESKVQFLPLTSGGPWPRDLRGRLKLNGADFKAYLPGVNCSGALEPSLTMECRPSDEPWPLDAGSRGLQGALAVGLNYFDGRLSTLNGARKSLAPFFSAAAVEENGKPYFLLALLDGRTQILDSSMEPVGAVAAWGSDVAGTEARCAGGSQILATRAGDNREPDELRAYGLVNRTPLPISPSLELPGPVTALWNAGGSVALAVVQDPASGHYQAYTVTVSCGG